MVGRGGRVRPPRPPVAREASCMIVVDSRSYCIDPAGGIAAALGKKWTLPLIGILGNRPAHRFSELREGLSGVGAKALTGRLRELQSLRLVSRDVDRRAGRHVEYRLSDRGEALRRALVPLLLWAGDDASTIS